MKSVSKYITSAVVFGIVMIVFDLISGNLTMSGKLVIRFIINVVVYCAVSMIIDAVSLKLKK